MIGKKFGHLTVTRLSEHRSGKRKRLMYYCDCDCGTKDYEVVGEHLRSGHTQSCGCLQREILASERKKFNRYEFNDKYIIGYAHNDNSVTFKIDFDDYDLIKNLCWSIGKNGYIFSTNLSTRERVYLHRFIMKPDDDLFVDHINHDKTDNRKINLRICDRCGNAKNSKMREDNTSGEKGVYYWKERDKWVAEINSDKIKYHIGVFDDFDSAKIARNNAEEKLFKEWSYKNSMNYSTEINGEC